MSEEKAKLEMTTAESQVKYYGVRLYTREELDSARNQAIADFLAECEMLKAVNDSSGKESVYFSELQQIAKKMRGEGKGGD